LFVLIVVAVSIYSLISVSVVFNRIHTLRNRHKEQSPASVRQNLATISHRCVNLRQVLTATFYLFGFLFFVGLQNAFIAVGDGTGFPADQILRNFAVHFAYAANMFLVFLILHLIQWIASSRLQALATQVSA
jgi:hypothetical protein